MQTVSLSLDFW